MRNNPFNETFSRDQTLGGYSFSIDSVVFSNNEKQQQQIDRM